MKSRSGSISPLWSFAYELLLGQGKRRLVLFVLALVSGILASAAPSRASTVGCAGASGGPFDFTSVTAALNAPGALVNNTITVSGTCTEFVLVAGAQNLQIIGTSGAVLVDPGGQFPPLGGVMEIDNSQGVVLQGLLMQMAARTVNTAIPAISVNSSDVRVVGCRLEGAGASDGIDMFQATVRLIGATIIENNNDGQQDGEGVALFGPSSLLLLLRDSSGNCPVLQGNGDSGIFAGRGGTTVRAPLGRGCATVQNNFVGITGNLGAIIELNSLQSSPGSVKVVNNLIGVLGQNGTHISINGPVLIQGNAQDGIRLRGSSGGLNTSDGTAGPTIQGNGTTLNPVCCAPNAGVSLTNNSSLDLTGGQVMSNAAPGVIVQDNSSVRLIGPVSITNNLIGLEVTDVSSAAFFVAPSISGNLSVDVVCGPSAVAHGDLSAVGKMNCPQFRPQLNAVTMPPRNRKAIP